MKHRRALIVVLFLVASQIAVGLVTSRTAGASVGPADDRQQTAATAWSTYTGVSAATLSTHLSQNGARLTSLQVDDPAGPTFTAVMVKNTFTYSSGWWWYYGQTQAQVSSLLT